VTYDRRVAGIVVCTPIAAPAEAVWAAIEDLSTHTRWMHDAVAIRFEGDQRSGTGTRFECDTKVGPLSLVDVMEITRWEPGRCMGVRHRGVVTGEGVFHLDPGFDGGTAFSWIEDLRFPWWLGGPVGAWLARPVLARIWRRNLEALRHLVETGCSS
jgi:hypothetical protein